MGGGDDAVPSGGAFPVVRLARPEPPVSPEAWGMDVFARFEDDPTLPALAVAEGGRIVGLVDRTALTATFAKPLMADLYGRRPVRLVMDPAPLLVEAASTLAEAGLRIASEKPAAMAGGFVVVRNGVYLGVASAIDLMTATVEEAELRSRQLEEARFQAEKANRAKTAFLANMSHEIRTPLNAMMGFADLLHQEVLGPLGNDLYRDYAGDIVASGRHLMDLINDLLDLSKADADRLELFESTVDVHRAALVCTRLLSERALRADVTVCCAVPPGIPALQADERKLRQMLLNLLSNAVKFTPPGGTITLDGGVDPDGALMLRCHDTGIGMSPADMEKALEPWGQVDSALARTHIGTGLGLPLTKALVEAHGGALVLDSVPGQGSVISLRFPPERVLAPVQDADSAPVRWTGDGG